jgi:hypothetical protein
MLNVTLQFTDLQCPLDIENLGTAIPQSSPQIKNNTHKSPGPGGPFSAWLRKGSSWYSPGNAFRLTLQETDGNLVLQQVDGSSFESSYTGGLGSPLNPNTQMRWVPVWSPFIQGKGVTEVDFQEDGNLVAYAGSQAVWSTGTNGIERPTLYMQDDGNLVIYTTGPTAKFATRTSALEAPGHNT